MGHVACKLQQNTRSLAYVVVLVKYDAPSLQLAINTLPSLHPGKFCRLKARGAWICGVTRRVVERRSAR